MIGYNIVSILFTTMSLFKYADVFGKPKEGAHATRALGLAVVDVGLTAVLALFFRHKVNAFCVLMVLSVLVHRAFCVHTTITDLVFKF
jgi:hypothetical protein